LEKAEGKRARFQNEKEGIGDRIQSLEGKMRDLREEEKDLRQTALTLSHEGNQSTGEMREEVEDLQLRNTLLTSSLSVIKSRFEAEGVEARDFSKNEEQQLNQYLAVMREENEQLQEKLLTVSIAIERLVGKKMELLDQGR